MSSDDRLNELAGQLANRAKQLDGGERVVRLATTSKDRQPPLTDAELIRLRAMIEQFDVLASPGGCPVARHVLDYPKG